MKNMKLLLAALAVSGAATTSLAHSVNCKGVVHTNGQTKEVVLAQTSVEPDGQGGNLPVLSGELDDFEFRARLEGDGTAFLRIEMLSTLIKTQTTLPITGVDNSERRLSFSTRGVISYLDKLVFLECKEVPDSQK